MRVFVTAGNTQVPIDRVRCITNIFTGRTGAAIALEAFRRGHEVTFVTSHPEAIRDLRGSMVLEAQRWHGHSYRTFEDLVELMTQHIAHADQDAVIHCAAVGDYRAAGIYAPAATTRFHEDDLCWQATGGAAPSMTDRSAGKVKSDEPELWLRMIRTPKLVDKIRRDWGYRGLLVKFKLEVGLAEPELRAIAEQSRKHSGADWMVANTLEGAAEWALLGGESGYKKLNRGDLPGSLFDVLEKQFQEMQRG